MFALLLALVAKAEPLTGGIRIPTVSPESSVSGRADLVVDRTGSWVQQTTVRAVVAPSEEVGLSVELAGGVAPLDGLQVWPGRLTLGLDGYASDADDRPLLTTGFELGIAPFRDAHRGAWADHSRDTTAGSHGAMRLVLSPLPEERLLLRGAVGLYVDPYWTGYFTDLRILTELGLAAVGPVAPGAAVVFEAEALTDYTPYHARLAVRGQLAEPSALDVGVHVAATTGLTSLAVGPVLRLEGRL